MKFTRRKKIGVVLKYCYIAMPLRKCSFFSVSTQWFEGNSKDLSVQHITVKPGTSPFLDHLLPVLTPQNISVSGHFLPVLTTHKSLFLDHPLPVLMPKHIPLSGLPVTCFDDTSQWRPRSSPSLDYTLPVLTTHQCRPRTSPFLDHPLPVLTTHKFSFPFIT